MAKSMSEKNIKTLVIILILLIVIGIGTIIFCSIYFLNDVTKGSDKSEANNINNSLQNEIAGESSTDYDYPEFDESKIVRTTENSEKEITYNIKEYDAQGVFSATIEDNKVYIKIEDINNKFKNLYQNSNLTIGQKYELKNINEKVVDVHFGYLGSDYSRLILLILCENGNVKYVDLSTSNTLNGEITVKENVIAKNIVRIENVIATENATETNTIILISSNGMSYNVQDLI